MRRRGAARALVLAAAGCIAGAALAAAAEPAGSSGRPSVASSGTAASADRVADPVHVYYGPGDCRGDQIELQVWDRDAEAWRPHPSHPRVAIPSCRVEDAGVLLNELRWRCVEPPGSDPPPVWVVGLDVFDPEVMSRCAVGQIEAGERRTAISVASPGEGVPVQAPEPVVPIEGSVRVDGLEGSAYEVVLAVDRSAGAAPGSPDPLAAQVAAARAFVRRLAPRLRQGAVRVAVVSYPNLPPRAGESSGARREIGLSGDPAAVDAVLAGLPRRPVASLPTLASALELALDEIASGRAGARGVIVAGFDGREDAGVGTGPERPGDPLRRAVERAARRAVTLHLFALGGLAEGAPPAIERALAEGRGSFARVLNAALGTDFLRGVDLPVAQDVWIESETRGGAPVRASVDARGRFHARVPVEAGANALRIHARTSDGSETSRRFDLVFDDTLILERVLEAERERIRRAQRKRLDLEVEHDVVP